MAVLVMSGGDEEQKVESLQPTSRQDQDEGGTTSETTRPSSGDAAPDGEPSSPGEGGTQASHADLGNAEGGEQGGKITKDASSTSLPNIYVHAKRWDDVGANGGYYRVLLIEGDPSRVKYVHESRGFAILFDEDAKQWRLASTGGGEGDTASSGTSEEKTLEQKETSASSPPKYGTTVLARTEALEAQGAEELALPTSENCNWNYEGTEQQYGEAKPYFGRTRPRELTSPAGGASVEESGKDVGEQSADEGKSGLAVGANGGSQENRRTRHARESSDTGGHFFALALKVRIATEEASTLPNDKKTGPAVYARALEEFTHSSKSTQFVLRLEYADGLEEHLVYDPRTADGRTAIMAGGESKPLGLGPDFAPDPAEVELKADRTSADSAFVFGCKYSAWQEPSPRVCSAVCGGGARRLIREVLAEPLHFVGEDDLMLCSSPLGRWDNGAEEGSVCNSQACSGAQSGCILSDWVKERLPCSAPCGGGFQMERRILLAGNEDECPSVHDSSRLRYTVCNTEPCAPICKVARDTVALREVGLPTQPGAKMWHLSWLPKEYRSKMGREKPQVAENQQIHTETDGSGHDSDAGSEVSDGDSSFVEETVNNIRRRKSKERVDFTKVHEQIPPVDAALDPSAPAPGDTGAGSQNDEKAENAAADVVDPDMETSLDQGKVDGADKRFFSGERLKEMIPWTDCTEYCMADTHSPPTQYWYFPMVQKDFTSFEGRNIMRGEQLLPTKENDLRLTEAEALQFMTPSGPFNGMDVNSGKFCPIWWQKRLCNLHRCGDFRVFPHDQRFAPFSRLRFPREADWLESVLIFSVRNPQTSKILVQAPKGFNFAHSSWGEHDCVFSLDAWRALGHHHTSSTASNVPCEVLCPSRRVDKNGQQKGCRQFRVSLERPLSTASSYKWQTRYTLRIWVQFPQNLEKTRDNTWTLVLSDVSNRQVQRIETPGIPYNKETLKPFRAHGPLAVIPHGGPADNEVRREFRQSKDEGRITMEGSRAEL
ncbi:unnamed protein product [Amoebophrya sp. A25]|nr:unnamed protein product [Amoebophrya sp. A25]|eukprot:GSA25T00000406001.1